MVAAAIAIIAVAVICWRMGASMDFILGLRSTSSRTALVHDRHWRGPAHAIAPSHRVARAQSSLRRLIRRLLPTTLTLDAAIAPAATMGLSRPTAANGIAAML